MGNNYMIEPDKIDRMERTLVGVEKAVVELATIQKEASKREERMYNRMDAVEEQVKQNTNLLWKFSGGIAALVTAATIIISIYAKVG